MAVCQGPGSPCDWLGFWTQTRQSLWARICPFNADEPSGYLFHFPGEDVGSGDPAADPTASGRVGVTPRLWGFLILGL